MFSGKTPPAEYNEAGGSCATNTRASRRRVAAQRGDFDPGAKYHVPANMPYMRYFLARIYQFQFHRALCKAAGHTGPLHRCSIYGSKAAGDKLKAMLAVGASRPWPEALQAMTGETQAWTRAALLEYFAPLQAWLDRQNKGKPVGWAEARTPRAAVGR